MPEPGNRGIDSWSGWLRTSLRLLTALSALFWISSYFVGVQWYHSDWKTAGPVASEEASWLVSNHGSIGFAWRSQRGVPGAPPPPDEAGFTAFDSSPSALDHVHPEGSFPWHWIHHAPTEYRMMGSMLTGYGHLYVPYWIPFLVSGLSAFWFARHANPKSTRSPEASPAGARPPLDHPIDQARGEHRE